MPSCSTVSLYHTSTNCAFLAAVFALTRLEGFASPYKHIRDAYIGAERAEMTSYTSEQTCRDDFIIGAELAEMIYNYIPRILTSEQNVPR
jgi:hypothetical protein